MLFYFHFQGLCNAASSITASYSNCTGSNAIGSLDRVVFIPDPPIVGQDFSIIGYGTTTEALTAPSYDLTIVDGSIINKDFDESACDNFEYKFPFSDGELIYVKYILYIDIDI